MQTPFVLQDTPARQHSGLINADLKKINRYSCTFAVLLKRPATRADTRHEIIRAGTFSDCNPSLTGLNCEWKTINTVWDSSFSKAQKKMYTWLMDWPHLAKIWNFLHTSDKTSMSKSNKNHTVRAPASSLCWEDIAIT